MDDEAGAVHVVEPQAGFLRRDAAHHDVREVREQDLDAVCLWREVKLAFADLDDGGPPLKRPGGRDRRVEGRDVVRLPVALRAVVGHPDDHGLRAGGERVVLPKTQLLVEKVAETPQVLCREEGEGEAVRVAAREFPFRKAEEPSGDLHAFEGAHELEAVHGLADFGLDTRPLPVHALL